MKSKIVNGLILITGIIGLALFFILTLSFSTHDYFFTENPTIKNTLV